MNNRPLHTARTALWLIATALCLSQPQATAAQDKHVHGHAAPASASRDLGTAAAFDHDGRLWVVTKETENADQYVVLRSSADMGKTWTPGRRIQNTPEPVAANGEARPHIAAGKKGELYISYTSTIARPHIGNIRFVRSLDGGKTFSAPMTVHANRDHVVHSFESMVVDHDGRLYIAWIDGRDATRAKQKNERYAGSAVYYAVSADQGESFSGDYKVADHACECCRIGLSLNQDGKPVAMWRHIFAPNIRDHAMAELRPSGTASEITRVTFDDWKVDACPHHGPSIAFGLDGKRHQVWFTGKEGAASSTLYAAEEAGKPGAATPLGTGQTSHPDLIVHEDQVAIVWKAFDGTSTAVVLKHSEDGGKTWTEKEAGRTAASSDSPYLIRSSDRVVLIWRTQNEGIRVIPLERKKT